METTFSHFLFCNAHNIMYLPTKKGTAMEYKKWTLNYYEKDEQNVFVHRVRVFRTLIDANSYMEMHLNDENIRIENLKAVW